MHTETPVHIPVGYIASLTDLERSEFRKMFESTSEADRDEIKQGDGEEWEAFSELHWQLVEYDEAEDEKALSKRDQVAMHVRRRCRPLSAIFETPDEYKRQSVLMAPGMVGLEEEATLPPSPYTPTNLKGSTPMPLGSHPPTEALVAVARIPRIPVSNDEDLGNDQTSTAKKAPGRLSRFMARAKSHVKRGK